MLHIYHIEMVPTSEIALILSCCLGDLILELRCLVMAVTTPAAGLAGAFNSDCTVLAP